MARKLLLLSCNANIPIDWLCHTPRMTLRKNRFFCLTIRYLCPTRKQCVRWFLFFWYSRKIKRFYLNLSARLPLNAERKKRSSTEMEKDVERRKITIRWECDNPNMTFQSREKWLEIKMKNLQLGTRQHVNISKEYLEDEDGDDDVWI